MINIFFFTVFQLPNCFMIYNNFKIKKYFPIVSYYDGFLSQNSVVISIKVDWFFKVKYSTILVGLRSTMSSLFDF